MRIGTGYDVHRLKAGRDLILGGVRIDHPLGLEGHSDADVLTHAVIDALLGAAALGDIGEHFPDSDPQWKGMSSLDLLELSARLLEKAGYRVVNIDSTLIAEEPRLHLVLTEMQRNIARRLGLKRDVVNVKATSPEGLGALGRSHGIAAQAVALIE
ncbi:MAG: 2-C-methyl-D-erythritol 2,4-cyclodiphosphate synthase [Chloroflexi bacterium]|nr:MAG: 2-C-methyl-D-erythritol 2,4-cyclodiphosphate synthase [Chloroflexota bacterium]